MSSRVFVPFDNNPISTIVKIASDSELATSYTVPNGKFAYVKDNFGGLQINNQWTNLIRAFSVTANSSVQTDNEYFGKTAGNNIRIAVSYSGTTPQSYARVYMGTDAGTGLLLANRSGAGSAIYQSVCNVTDIFAVAYRQTSGTASCSIYIFSDQCFEGWVPAGTILSGINYTITEYNAVT